MILSTWAFELYSRVRSQPGSAPLVEKWLDGYDVDVLCYGQTGSGKTYTMFGPPRAMAEAASQLKSSGGGSSTISSKGVVKSDVSVQAI